jgi:hypothetical protein
VWDHVSHPYKTTGRIMFLFLEGRLNSVAKSIICIKLISIGLRMYCPTRRHLKVKNR